MYELDRIVINNHNITFISIGTEHGYKRFKLFCVGQLIPLYIQKNFFKYLSAQRKLIHNSYGQMLWVRVKLEEAIQNWHITRQWLCNHKCISPLQPKSLGGASMQTYSARKSNRPSQVILFYIYSFHFIGITLTLICVILKRSRQY